ncbi:hypothetical protein, partial [Streptomyces sp. DSM 41033]|uniref:hypothetical protein n=1 Tax=Streptomyces sp. DSM 41033 TaxID=3448655 RepID=UPI00403FE5F7
RGQLGVLALRTEGDARADMTALNDVLSTAVAPGSNLVIAALRCASLRFAPENLCSMYHLDLVMIWNPNE